MRPLGGHIANYKSNHTRMMEFLREDEDETVGMPAGDDEEENDEEDEEEGAAEGAEETI